MKTDSATFFSLTAKVFSSLGITRLRGSHTSLSPRLKHCVFKEKRRQSAMHDRNGIQRPVERVVVADRERHEDNIGLFCAVGIRVYHLGSDIA